MQDLGNTLRTIAAWALDDRTVILAHECGAEMLYVVFEAEGSERFPHKPDRAAERELVQRGFTVSGDFDLMDNKPDWLLFWAEGDKRYRLCSEALAHARELGVPIGIRPNLDLGKFPVVLDPRPGCGAKAVAVGALKGAYICPPGSGLSGTGPEWTKTDDGDAFPEIVQDDGDACADIALVDCGSSREFEQAVHEFGVRCDRVVGFLPWRDRERLLNGLPGTRVIRHLPRPYQVDTVLAVWEQA